MPLVPAMLGMVGWVAAGTWALHPVLPQGGHASGRPRRLRRGQAHWLAPGLALWRRPRQAHRWRPRRPHSSRRATRAPRTRPPPTSTTPRPALPRCTPTPTAWASRAAPPPPGQRRRPHHWLLPLCACTTALGAAPPPATTLPWVATPRQQATPTLFAEWPKGAPCRVEAARGGKRQVGHGPGQAQALGHHNTITLGPMGFWGSYPNPLLATCWQHQLTLATTCPHCLGPCQLGPLQTMGRRGGQ